MPGHRRSGARVSDCRTTHRSAREDGCVRRGHLPRSSRNRPHNSDRVWHGSRRFRAHHMGAPRADGSAISGAAQNRGTNIAREFGYPLDGLGRSTFRARAGSRVARTVAVEALGLPSAKLRSLVRPAPAISAASSSWGEAARRDNSAGAKTHISCDDTPVNIRSDRPLHVCAPFPPARCKKLQRRRRSGRGLCMFRLRTPRYVGANFGDMGHNPSFHTLHHKDWSKIATPPTRSTRSAELLRGITPRPPIRGLRKTHRSRPTACGSTA